MACDWIARVRGQNKKKDALDRVIHRVRGVWPPQAMSFPSAAAPPPIKAPHAHQCQTLEFSTGRHSLSGLRCVFLEVLSTITIALAFTFASPSSISCASLRTHCSRGRTRGRLASHISVLRRTAPATRLSRLAGAFTSLSTTPAEATPPRPPPVDVSARGIAVHQPAADPCSSGGSTRAAFLAAAAGGRVVWLAASRPARAVLGRRTLHCQLFLLFIAIPPVPQPGVVFPLSFSLSSLSSQPLF